jgi:ATP synthase mitochondrial F1 complex assembly factor 2
VAVYGHTTSRRTTSYSYEPYLSLHLAFVVRSRLTTSNTGAEATQKRFWKEVGIEKRGDSLTVILDKRALKTPAGQTLLLPLNKTLSAALIAAEWDHQEILLKPHALPMVKIQSLA